MNIQSCIIILKFQRIPHILDLFIKVYSQHSIEIVDGFKFHSFKPIYHHQEELGVRWVLSIVVDVELEPVNTNEKHDEIRKEVPKGR